MRPTALLASLMAAVAAFSACSEEDTGNCCTSITRDADNVPLAETADGGLPRNLVAEHPTFDCEKLACVSWEGSDAFCTRRCNTERPCPDGFNCQPVLESGDGGVHQRVHVQVAVAGMPEHDNVHVRFPGGLVHAAKVAVQRGGWDTSVFDDLQRAPLLRQRR